jgi:DNA (cytosine-5)-methyltransferase 1
MACKDSGGWSNSADHAAAGYMVPVGTICVATGQAGAEIGAEIGADMAPTLNCNHEAPYVARTLLGKSNCSHAEDKETYVCFDTTQITSAANYSSPKAGDPCHPLAAGAHAPAIAFPANLSGTQCASTEDLAPSMGASNPTGGAYGIRTANTSSNGWGIQEECTHTLDCAQGVAVAFGWSEELNALEDLQPTIQRGGAGGRHEGVAYTTKLHNTQSNQAGKVYEEYTVGLDRNSPPPALLTAMQVRRLTPGECESLQGFPQGYTNVPHRNKPAADGPRYKALGNSWAVPNVRWIGQRIDAVQSIKSMKVAP